MYWTYDTMENKWYLWNETDDGEQAIAEIGQDEEDTIPGLKTYYWIELENETGYYGYDTIDEAKSAVEAYFKGYLV